MKKTIYKRLRLGGILLCLMLIVSCIAPLSAFAAEATVTEQDSIHFINPTAMTVVSEDYLYVADNVEDGKTAILRFSLAGETPTLDSTIELNERVTGLSYYMYGYDDAKTDKRVEKPMLYAVCGNKVLELEANLDDKNQPVIKNTFNFDNDVKGFVNGSFVSSDDVEYALTDRLLRYDDENNSFVNATDTLTDTKGCIALNNIVYYVHKKGANFVCDGYRSNASLLSNSLTITTEPIGITTYKNNVAFFSQHSIMYVNDVTMGYWTTNKPLQGNALENLIADTGDKTILDVAISGETLFVLNENINTIDMYVKGDNGYSVAYTIGSDTVNKTVPTSYNSFTLVRPNGYPANIVYKTKESTSIDEIITDASEYVILGYEGDANSHYYYVMVGDKFGWVKKSDGATAPAKDNKLTVVNNNLSEGPFTYETKFTSLNGVYVYDLPLGSANQTSVTQTASAMKSVKVLQEFKEGDQVWYYVSYDEGKTGFVKQSDVGQMHISSSAAPSQIETVGLRKINSSLFAAVNLHATAELAENDFVCDVDGNQIRLYSGDRVTLVKEENGSAFVMILHNNGQQDFGWIEASRLIDVHQITTNAIVGLVLLAVAIALAAILLIVYFKRRKRIRANKD